MKFYRLAWMAFVAAPYVALVLVLAAGHPLAQSMTITPLFGTLATQNANAVAITGGTINGATVGATTPATIKGTSITGTSYVVGAAAGVDASIVIPAVATITVTKGIITAVVGP